jgi:hypothetical protein
VSVTSATIGPGMRAPTCTARVRATRPPTRSTAAPIFDSARSSRGHSSRPATQATPSAKA